MPFDKAAQMIEEILGVQTDEETVRQLTERMGRTWKLLRQRKVILLRRKKQKISQHRSVVP
jgi:hypothetical protein